MLARALPQDKTRLVRLAQETGLVVGMTTAWIFGNNEVINSLFDVIFSLITSEKIEHIAIVPASIIAVVVFVFYINGIIFSSYCFCIIFY